MKKRFNRLFLTLSFFVGLFVFCISTEAAENKEKNPVDTGASEQIADTGVSYANLGQSFYARISLSDPELYFTVPDNVMDTTQLKAYTDNGSQIWHFTRQSDGSYKIRNVGKNLYMELYNGTPSENGETFHTEADNLPDQRWILQSVGNAYQLITCCDTSYMLKGVNLYGNYAELHISRDSYRDSTHFIITKLPYTSDYLSTPAVTLSPVVGGVTVNWSSIPYATSYRVYRYNDSTKKWVALKTTTGLTYTDKTVVSGKTYQYTVKCITPLTSKYQSKSITYIAAPSPKVSNTVSGPVISWAKVNGAQAYRVFYKSGSTWKALATTSSTSYTHKNASYNVNYTYTVRCMTADGKKYTSAYNTTGVKNRIVQTPKFTVTLDPNGFQLNWNKINGAYRYKVMIKSKATNWTWSKSYTCIYNNFFYSEPLDNEAYYFTVRCMDENNNYISGYTTSAKYMYYSAPHVTKFVSTSSTTSLTWKKVPGAAKYRVFSWNGQKWVKRTDTTAVSVNIKNTGTAAQNACFAVRCMDKNGKYISSYYETVLSGGSILSYHSGGYTSKHKF